MNINTKAKLQDLKHRVVTLAQSSRGHKAITYAIFLLISTMFWFMMTLNDEVQRDYAVEIDVAELPTDITLLSDITPTVNLSVKDKGRAFVKYDLGKKPRLKLKFSDFRLTDDNRLILSSQKLKSAVRELFGSNSQIVFMSPDSISVKFTSNPGVKLPVYANVDIQASPQHIVHGKIILEPDSVTLYAAQGIPSSIVSLKTSRLSARELTDTTSYTLTIETPPGMRAVPDKITAKVPVEPLISKSRDTEIATVNVPSGIKLIPFPSNIKITYLLPMSLYNNELTLPEAIIDYNDIKHGSSSIPVRLSFTPDYYQSTTISPQQVEYVIENLNTND